MRSPHGWLIKAHSAKKWQSYRHYLAYLFWHLPMVNKSQRRIKELTAQVSQQLGPQQVWYQSSSSKQKLKAYKSKHRFEMMQVQSHNVNHFFLPARFGVDLALATPFGLALGFLSARRPFFGAVWGSATSSPFAGVEKIKGICFCPELASAFLAFCLTAALTTSGALPAAVLGAAFKEFLMTGCPAAGAFARALAMVWCAKEVLNDCLTWPLTMVAAVYGDAVCKVLNLVMFFFRLLNKIGVGTMMVFPTLCLCNSFQRSCFHLHISLRFWLQAHRCINLRCTVSLRNCIL